MRDPSDDSGDLRQRRLPNRDHSTIVAGYRVPKLYTRPMVAISLLPSGSMLSPPAPVESAG